MSRLVLVLLAFAAGCTDGGGEPARPRSPAPLCNPVAPATAGPSPLRRLTRDQYDRSVRDLLGVSGPYATVAVAPDEQAGAFRSNAITAVTRLTVEQLLEVGADVASDIDLASLAPCNRLSSPPRDCARSFIERLLPRAYRRPAGPGDVERLLAVYDANEASGYDAALRIAVQAMLSSPYFLYHLEPAAAGAGAIGLLVPLDPYALASRMSYFLWGTMPDDVLFAAAADGTLATAEGVTAEAQRMMEDPRAADAIASFHAQWLEIESLDAITKDPVRFPSFDAAMRGAMRAETERFADHVIRRGDGSLRTLLTASYSLLDGPLFDHYGVERPAGHDPSVPVALDAGERAGILTHASVLSTHAHVQLSSLALRGKLVRERFFCQELPDPPDDVDLTLPEERPGTTTRERFEQHVASPSCASCHLRIDPIGFGFEGYDAIGAFRSTDNGVAVDDAGELTETDVDASFDGAVELAARLAESPMVERCVARQWLRFALGRMETPDDACTLDRLYQAMEAPDDLRALLVAIVSSDAFRFRRTAQEGASP